MSYLGVIVPIIANKLVIYLDENFSVRLEGSWSFMIRKTNLSLTEIVFFLLKLFLTVTLVFSSLKKRSKAYRSN